MLGSGEASQGKGMAGKGGTGWRESRLDQGCQGDRNMNDEMKEKLVFNLP